MNAAIIIPVHNRRETTLRCLRNLGPADLVPEFGIIVVDDGSTDGTGEAIAAEFPNVTVATGDGELYWTGAMVVGMKRALEAGASYLFWLNDDCLPERGALDRMLQFLRANPKTVCGASCFVDNLDQPVETAFHRRTRVKATDGVIEVEGLSGYCVGMPATLCEEIGLPNAERLPHYAADSIYTLLAHRRGFRIVLLADARVKLLDEKVVPTLGERARAWRDGRWTFVHRTFFQRKSPYFLKGQYWYHRYKYGFLLGSALFILKIFAWSWKTATCLGHRAQD